MREDLMDLRAEIVKRRVAGDADQPKGRLY